MEREVQNDSGVGRPLNLPTAPRKDRPETLNSTGTLYQFDEYVNFLEALRAGGIQTRPLSQWGSPGLYLFHDIHNKIAPCRSFAREEAARRLCATYFIMPRSSYNRSWFDTPLMWETLDAVRRGGGEIGLHIDPFDLCPVRPLPRLLFPYVQVLRKIRLWKAFFRRRGFDLKVANLHGSTRYYKSGMVASDFFGAFMRPKAVIEGCDPSPYWSWFGRLHLTPLPFRYVVSLLAVSTRFRSPFQLPDYYLSDNSRNIVLHRIPPDAPREELFVDFHANVLYLKRTGRFRTVETRMEVQSPPWRLDPDSIRDILRRIRGKTVVALFHPQWYEGA